MAQNGVGIVLWCLAKRFSLLDGSWGTADGAALPLDLGMAGSDPVWDQKWIPLYKAHYFRSQMPLITPEY